MNGLIKPAISPPGEKLVIKKSEIKFGGNSPSNSPPPPCNLMQGKKSPQAQGGVVIKNAPQPKKELTIDIIKKMINEP